MDGSAETLTRPLSIIVNKPVIFLGRELDSLNLAPSNSDTQSFKSLLEIRNISCKDTMELFKGLQNFNPYAKEMRHRLKESLCELENLLEEC